MSAEIVHLTPETVAQLCLNKYRELSKTGKPTETQWTVLAGIVLHNKSKNNSQVIALGLGTKCIGRSNMCRNGFIINDSHAEVLARRSLLRYLYYQIKESNRFGDTTTAVTWDAEKRVYRVKPEYSFHFFSSQPPCGDACIINTTALTAETTPAKRRKLSTDGVWHEANNLCEKLTSNVVYTGAKLLCDGSSSADRMAQVVGALRIKPGKGDPTLSMSCSDKLSKWCFLGVQGALITILLEKPIYFSSMAFMQGCSLEALQRAIYDRWKTNQHTENACNAFRQNEPLIRLCNDTVVFECAQTENRNQPCPNGLVWCNVPEKFKACEVIVNGKRQGCTKKALKTPEAALKISKYQLFKDFIDVLREKKDILDRCNLKEEHLNSLSYSDAKKLSKSYQEAWTSLKEERFEQWIQKPSDMLKFSLKTLSII